MSCHTETKALSSVKTAATGKRGERCEEKKAKRRMTVVKTAALTPALILLSSMVSLAQETKPASNTFWSDPFDHPLLPVYLIAFFVFIVIMLTMVVSLVTYRVLKVLIREADEAKAAKMGVPFVAEVSWWTKFWVNANALVPLEEEKNIELDHNYDGIRELDNHLPPWWKGLFYGSIIFAVLYLSLYHLSDVLPLSGEEYENEISKAEEQARIQRASQPVELIDETKLVFSKDEALITSGKRAFIGNNCGSCHRNDGGGNTIGPNLTDMYWLHGGNIKNVFSTIKNGAVEKGMPAWGKVMSQKQLRDLAFYVMSLQGTNPPAGKAPQGELFKQDPVAPADSAKTSSLNR